MHSQLWFSSEMLVNYTCYMYNILVYNVWNLPDVWEFSKDALGQIRSNYTYISGNLQI